jgi:Spy/CpxP family protein refolding chaperone
MLGMTFFCNRSVSSAVNSQQRRNPAPQTYKNMKQTLTVIAAVALGAFSLTQAQPPGEGHGGWHLNPLEEMSSSLNLTDAQKAKVQPIVDQAKPQLQAIHQEAMTKAKTVIDGSITQIRPLLTPEQQTKLDAIVKAHEDMHNAMKELHDAKGK